MRIVQEDELRRAIDLSPETVAVVEKGFAQLSTGLVEMPPIMRVDIPEHHGEVDVKTAYIRGETQFAIKLSSGFFRNYTRGLPNSGGMMIVLSAETGVPAAVLLDNGYLTTVRTAAARAIAAKYLAPDLTTVGVIGAGLQARWQVMAVQSVKPFQRLLVHGRTPPQLQQYIEEMRPLLACEIEQAPSAEALVRASDLVITTTPSSTPVIQAAWLHPGLHITAMGSDAESKQELEAAVLARADLLVCDSRAQCFRLGELHHALESGLLSLQDDVVELGEIIAGHRAGRTSPDHITVCDLTGTGVQDTAIATFALRQIDRPA